MEVCDPHMHHHPASAPSSALAHKIWQGANSEVYTSGEQALRPSK